VNAILHSDRPSALQVPRLIAIDMDGTLLGATGQVSARNLEALRSAERAGAEVVIATGRRHCYAMDILRDLHLNPANAVVSSNGTVVRTIGAELLHRTLLPLPTARWLCAHLADFRNTLVLTFDAVGLDGEGSQGALVVEHLDELNSNVGWWMQSNRASIRHVEQLESALEHELPIQIMLCGSLDRMRLAEERLLEQTGVSGSGATAQERLHGPGIAVHRTEYTSRDLCIVDILPAGCSKGAALLRYAANRGLEAADILAIGDNWNDVSMLEVAGQAVLMANAPKELKLLAVAGSWTMGLSNENDGVAVAIEEALNL